MNSNDKENLTDTWDMLDALKWQEKVRDLVLKNFNSPSHYVFHHTSPPASGVSPTPYYPGTSIPSGIKMPSSSVYYNEEDHPNDHFICEDY